MGRDRDERLREVMLLDWLLKHSIVKYNEKTYRLPLYQVRIILNLYRDVALYEEFDLDDSIIVVGVLMMIVSKFWEDEFYFEAKDISEILGLELKFLLLLEFELICIIKTDILFPTFTKPFNHPDLFRSKSLG